MHNSRSVIEVIVVIVVIEGNSRAVEEAVEEAIEETIGRQSNVKVYGMKVKEGGVNCVVHVVVVVKMMTVVVVPFLYCIKITSVCIWKQHIISHKTRLKVKREAGRNRNERGLQDSHLTHN